MRSDIKDLHLAHELDAAWIIALWFWIHDGDPAPEGLVNVDHETIRLAAELSQHLTGAATKGTRPQLTLSRLQTALKTLGVQVSEGGIEMRAENLGNAQTEHEPPPYCFQFKGQTICVPRLKRVRNIASA